MADIKKWYADTGSHGDVVLSTRVRLARNMEGLPFPARLSQDGRARLNAAVCRLLADAPQKLYPIDMGALLSYEAVALAERHLISPDFAGTPQGRVLLLSEDESVSIMVGEQDHLRLQVIYGGLCLDKAYETADRLDDFLDEKCTYAFDDKLGYLTQSPADLGTGMRASVMLHLPALAAQGGMLRFASTVAKLGLTLRGVFGEGGMARGDIYLLGNRVTMGLSEETALANLESIALQLATRERNAAESYVTDIAVKDRIRRAQGLLTNAMLLSCDEMLDALSFVRLGAVYGLLAIRPETVNELFISMQPANINVAAGKPLPRPQRDELRAEMVRNALQRCSETGSEE